MDPLDIYNVDVVLYSQNKSGEPASIQFLSLKLIFCLYIYNIKYN